MKKRRRLKKKAIISAFILAISLSGIIYSIINIFSWKKDTKENNKIKEEIKENIKLDEETKEYIIDFDKLKEQNEDTIAYLKIENTNIEYPVVKGKDNDYYLNHNFKKEYNSAGWIFADYRNKFDGTDKNIIIYGHNMKDGSMFNNLKDSLNSKWKDKNHTITLKTKDKETKYQIFSTYTIEPEEYYTIRGVLGIFIIILGAIGACYNFFKGDRRFTVDFWVSTGVLGFSLLMLAF